MNQQCIATQRNRIDGMAKGKFRMPADGSLLVVKGKRIRPRPNHVVPHTGPLPAPVDGTAVRAGPESESNPLRLADQRRALLALRTRLQGDLIETAQLTLGNGIETTVDSPDTVDCASGVVEQDLAVSLLGSATVTLDQIETALQRIEDGKYDRCLECGTRIPAARLEAVPYATRCVDCAARQEQIG